MNWKNRLTNYNFWISLVSAILLILQAFNFEFDIANLNEIATALLGLLVVIGIISNPTKSNSDQKQNSNQSKDKESQTNDATENISSGIKENIDSMPSGEQNEDNLNTSEDDLKVLIDKISSDIALETGILRENVANVVNEIIKTYEEGEFMLDTDNKEIENISENTIEEVSPTDIDVEEIAEELLEKEDIEINDELAEKVNEEYNEFQNMIQEELMQENSDESNEIEGEIQEIVESTDEEILVETEVIVDEQIDECEMVQDFDENEIIDQEIPENIIHQEEKHEEVITFKIVN